MSSGAVTISPGYLFASPSDDLTYAKLAQAGNPTARIAAGAITAREISSTLVPVDPSKNALLFEDFLQVAPTVGATSGLIGINRLRRVSLGNNCTVESAAAVAGYAGLVILTDCVDGGGSGYCMIRGASGSEQWKLGSGEITVEWKIISPNALSSGAADTYALYIGLADGASSCSGPANGVYFSYTHTVSSGAWVAMTTAASTTTSVVGSTMVVSTAYTLKAVINAAGTSVEFFINGVSIGTSITTIPTAALTYFCGMNDTVSSAASNSFFVDWVRISQTFTNPR